MIGKVKEPEKELRFTRAGQSEVYWVLATLMVGIATVVVFTALNRGLEVGVLGWVGIGIWLVVAAGVYGLAGWMTHYAYVILSPVGVEIFPLYRPRQGFTVVVWGDIAAWEYRESKQVLVLHYTKEKRSGVQITLKPIRKNRRGMLLRAMEGRLGEAEES